jgi:hypothetical protein
MSIFYNFLKTLISEKLEVIPTLIGTTNLVLEDLVIVLSK